MFKTRQQGEYVYITEYVGEENRCTIPTNIGDAIVKGIDRFAFSEKRELVEIVLSESVESIGAHAFYNCRSLKSIVMGDGVTDIGDGAFKNCYNISDIKIIRTHNNTRCLKGILSEVNNETTVTIEYPDGTSKVVFPYYLDNYEENTPARIITQITSGSGIRYRECITGEDINYAEYDNIFLQAMHIDVQESAAKIAMGRINYPYHLSDKAKEQYRAYLFDNRVELLLKLAKDEKYEELNEFLNMKLITAEDLKYCINKAREESLMEGLGIMLAFQRENYGTTKKIFEF
ncbi:MAG: leucine-rich repeat domain-containing protein [Lachnospira sp.]|nr:leucine-rich repeat domain-containing protein [Lachnospira sp.]